MLRSLLSPLHTASGLLGSFSLRLSFNSADETQQVPLLGRSSRSGQV